MLLSSSVSNANQSGDINVPGSRLHYVIEGTGRPCLVIGSSVYYPRTFSKSLRKHLKLIFVDMRWFAPITKPLPIYSLATVVDDIDKVRQTLKLDKPIIMGHSIHGTIALEYARRHRENVSGVVTIGSPVLMTSDRYDASAEEIWKTASQDRQKLQNENWHNLPDLNKHAELQPDVENYLAMAPKYWFNPRYNARWLWKGMTIHSNLLHHLYNDVFKNYDMFGNEQSVPVPTFSATGLYDYVIPHTSWVEHQDIPSLTVSVFHKSGHTPQLEEPELFDQHLLHWLNQHQEHSKR